MGEVMAEFPMVGIGSSAGGLEALQALFRGLPADSGLAFVVAAHLDPTQKSHLSELLSRCTEMPVVQIEKSIKVEHVPYRTGRDGIDGVVATFTEITGRKGLEEAIQAARTFAESIVDTVREPLLWC